MNFEDIASIAQHDPVDLAKWNNIATKFVSTGIIKKEKEFLERWSETSIRIGIQPGSPSQAFNKSDFDVCGFGLYPQLVLLKHSCRPNAHIVFDGLKLRVRALAFVDTNRKNVTMNLGIGLLKPWLARQDEISRLHMFRCHCVRCIYDLPRQFYDDYYTQPSLVNALERADKISECYAAAKIELEQIKMMLGKYSREGTSRTGLMVKCAHKVISETSTLITPKDELIELVKEAEDVYHVTYGEFNPFYCETIKQTNKLLASALEYYY